MSELILKKQNKKEVNKTASINRVTRSGKVFIKPLLVLMVMLGFLVMSVNNDNLYLTELLVGTGIVVILSLVHILQK